MANLRERLLKKKTELATKGGGGSFFTIKEGTSRLRLLPVGDEKEFAIEATYFYLEPDIKGVVSPATFGGKCAIMEAYNELSQSKDPDDRELAKKLKPQRKYFAPAVRFKDDKGKELDGDGVKLVIMTSGQYQDLIDLFLDDDEAGDFTDPKNGYDIKFSRVGKTKMDTEYSIRPCKPTLLPKSISKDGPFDPEEMLKKIAPTYKETKAFVEQYLKIGADKDEDTEEDDAPVKKKKKLVKKKRDI